MRARWFFHPVAARFERVSGEMADMRERMGRVEGLLDGLRDAVTGRHDSA